MRLGAPLCLMSLLLSAALAASADETGESRKVPADEAIYATPIAFIAAHTRAVDHELGRGVPRDVARAAELYRVSAELGYAESQNDLARLYDQGRGVAEDAARAYYWYTLAMEQGNACALHERENLIERMSEAELDDARALLRARVDTRSYD